MKVDQRVDKIIDHHLSDLRSGQTSIEAILEKYPDDASILRPRLEAVVWLIHANQTLRPRPGFIASSRKYLEQRIAGLPRRTTWQRLTSHYSPQRWVFNLFAPVLLVAVLVLVINNLVLAARLSIPGEPFYSTKLFLEDIRLAFTLNPEDKTELYLQYSRERTSEFVDLVLEGDYDLLPTAAGRMESDIIAAIHSLDNMTANNSPVTRPMLTSVRDTLANEIMMLKVLEDTSPSSARPGIDKAIQVAQSGVFALH